MENKQGFNPNEHLIKIKTKRGLAEYLPVQGRLMWFRDQHPHGIITTELAHLDLERQIAVFHARVEDGEGGVGEGYGSESAKDFDDYIEKAGTKAIGRALLVLGFGTAFAADDLNEDQHLVDTPVIQAKPAIQPVQPARAAANAEPEETPTIKDLQKRCNALFGVGFWQAMVLKALKVENMDIVLKDNDLTPQDRFALKKYMDFAEAKKAS